MLVSGLAVLIELLQLDSSMCTSSLAWIHPLSSGVLALENGWKEQTNGRQRASESHEKYSKPALFSHFINFSLSLLRILALFAVCPVLCRGILWCIPLLKGKSTDRWRGFCTD